MEISLVICKYITSECVTEISKQCGPTLSSLKVAQCSQLNDDAFRLWRKQTINCIKKLHLYGLKSVTDSCLRDLIQNFKLIESLDLSGCLQITDETGLAIAYNCPNIKDLRLIGCELLTDNSIKEIARNCLRIEKNKLEQYTFTY